MSGGRHVDLGSDMESVTVRAGRSARRPASRDPAAREAPLEVYARSWPALARSLIALRGALRGEGAEPLVAAIAARIQPGATIILARALDDRRAV